MSTNARNRVPGAAARILEERRKSLTAMKKDLDGLENAVAALKTAHAQACRCMESLKSNHHMSQSDLYRDFNIPQAMQTFLKAKVEPVDTAGVVSESEGLQGEVS